MPFEQLRSFDSQLLSIIADGMESQPQAVVSDASISTPSSAAMIQNVNVVEVSVLSEMQQAQQPAIEIAEGNVQTQQPVVSEGTVSQQAVVPEGSDVSQTIPSEGGVVSISPDCSTPRETMACSRA
jgi:hypothetical protein